MSKKNEDLSFEAAIERMESIVRQMENGNLNLQESMALYEEGVKLAKFCQKELDLARQKVEKITLTGNGEVKTEPFLEREV